MISVFGAIVRIHVANNEQKKTCLRGRKGVVRRESGMKGRKRSGECVRVEEGEEIGGVKSSRAGVIYGMTVGREI